MIIVDAVFALGIAFFLTVVFIALGRRARSWHRVLALFVFTFLAVWAGGIWITPIGPRLLGVYWLTFLVAGLVFSLVLAAIAAFFKPAVPAERIVQMEGRQEREIARVFNIFAVVLGLVFIAVIVIGYVLRSR